MKLILCLAILSCSAIAENLSLLEQKRLIEENKKLKAELEACKSNPSTQDSKKLMQTLERGKKFQEDQLRALEELEKED